MPKPTRYNGARKSVFRILNISIRINRTNLPVYTDPMLKVFTISSELLVITSFRCSQLCFNVVNRREWCLVDKLNICVRDAVREVLFLQLDEASIATFVVTSNHIHFYLLNHSSSKERWELNLTTKIDYGGPNKHALVSIDPRVNCLIIIEDMSIKVSERISYKSDNKMKLSIPDSTITIMTDCGQYQQFVESNREFVKTICFPQNRGPKSGNSYNDKSMVMIVEELCSGQHSVVWSEWEYDKHKLRVYWRVSLFSFVKSFQMVTSSSSICSNRDISSNSVFIFSTQTKILAACKSGILCEVDLNNSAMQILAMCHISSNDFQSIAVTNTFSKSFAEIIVITNDENNCYNCVKTLRLVQVQHGDRESSNDSFRLALSDLSQNYQLQLYGSDLSLIENSSSKTSLHPLLKSVDQLELMPIESKYGDSDEYLLHFIAVVDWNAHTLLFPAVYSPSNGIEESFLDQITKSFMSLLALICEEQYTKKTHTVSRRQNLMEVDEMQDWLLHHDLSALIKCHVVDSRSYLHIKRQIVLSEEEFIAFPDDLQIITARDKNSSTRLVMTSQSYRQSSLWLVDSEETNFIQHYPRLQEFTEDERTLLYIDLDLPTMKNEEDRIYLQITSTCLRLTSYHQKLLLKFSLRELFTSTNVNELRQALLLSFCNGKLRVLLQSVDAMHIFSCQLTDKLTVNGKPEITRINVSHGNVLRSEIKEREIIAMDVFEILQQRELIFIGWSHWDNPRQISLTLLQRCAKHNEQTEVIEQRTIELPDHLRNFNFNVSHIRGIKFLRDLQSSFPLLLIYNAELFAVFRVEFNCDNNHRAIDLSYRFIASKSLHTTHYLESLQLVFSTDRSQFVFLARTMNRRFLNIFLRVQERNIIEIQETNFSSDRIQCFASFPKREKNHYREISNVFLLTERDSLDIFTRSKENTRRLVLAEYALEEKNHHANKMKIRGRFCQFLGENSLSVGECTSSNHLVAITSISANQNHLRIRIIPRYAEIKSLFTRNIHLSALLRSKDSHCSLIGISKYPSNQLLARANASDSSVIFTALFCEERDRLQVISLCCDLLKSTLKLIGRLTIHEFHCDDKIIEFFHVEENGDLMILNSHGKLIVIGWTTNDQRKVISLSVLYQEIILELRRDIDDQLSIVVEDKYLIAHRSASQIVQIYEISSQQLRHSSNRSYCVQPLVSIKLNEILQKILAFSFTEETSEDNLRTPRRLLKIVGLIVNSHQEHSKVMILSLFMRQSQIQELYAIPSKANHANNQDTGRFTSIIPSSTSDEMNCEETTATISFVKVPTSSSLHIAKCKSPHLLQYNFHALSKLSDEQFFSTFINVQL